MDLSKYKLSNTAPSQPGGALAGYQADKFSYSPTSTPSTTNLDKYRLAPEAPSDNSIAGTPPEAPSSNNNFEKYFVNPVNEAVTWWQETLPVRAASTAVGGLVKGVGNIVGGAEGAVFETAHQAYNALTGKGFNAAKIGETTKMMAQEVGNFGEEIGQGGTKAASLGPLGKVPQAIITVPQLYQGSKDVYSGVKEGDLVKGFQGATELAGGLMSAYGLKNAKGAFLNKEFTQPIGQKLAPITEKVTAPINKWAVNKIASNNERYLNLTKKQRSYETNTGKSAAKLLAKEGIDLQSVGNNVDTTQAQADLSRIADEANKVYTQVLKNRPEQVTVNEWATATKKAINTPKNRALGGQYKKMLKYIDEEAAAYKEIFGSPENTLKNGDVTVPISVANEIKSGQWAKAFTRNFQEVDGKVFSDVDFQLGHTMKNIIESRVSDLPIKKMNSYLGDLAEATKILKDRNGAGIKGSWTNKLTGRMLGGVIGHTLGPVSTVGGILTGDSVAKFISTPEFSDYVPNLVKRLTKQPGGSQILDDAIKILDQQRAEINSRPRLGGPSSIQMPPSATPTKAQTALGAMEVGKTVNEPAMGLENVRGTIEAQPKLLGEGTGESYTPIELPGPKATLPNEVVTGAEKHPGYARTPVYDTPAPQKGLSIGEHVAKTEKASVDRLMSIDNPSDFSNEMFKMLDEGKITEKKAVELASQYDKLVSNVEQDFINSAPKETTFNNTEIENQYNNFKNILKKITSPKAKERILAGDDVTFKKELERINPAYKAKAEYLFDSQEMGNAEMFDQFKSRLMEENPEYATGKSVAKGLGLKGRRGSISLPYKESGDLTTKLLKKLEGKTTVSKQFISDLTNSPDLKQVEKDLIRDVLAQEPDKVDVTEFSQKVKQELLPLDRKSLNKKPNSMDIFYGSESGQRYEGVTLKEKLRGDVANYDEHVYESPIQTQASKIHFEGKTNNYFGHTRTEDMAGPEKLRRVIEVQSDLYQKNNLETQLDSMSGKDSLYGVKKSQELLKEYEQKLVDYKENELLTNFYKDQIEKISKGLESEKNNRSKLQQYNNPTAHFRMVREEVAQAVKDGKKKLQFPTGETAMKIEGLGNQDIFSVENKDGFWNVDLTPDNIEVGKKVLNRRSDNTWVVTEVLDDGKFKAIPERKYNEAMETGAGGLDRMVDADRGIRVRDYQETFDVSGKPDTTNPIYKFYEKDLARYLKNKYDSKLVTDNKGVTWNEVEIKPEYKNSVEAFGRISPGGLVGGNIIAGGALAVGTASAMLAKYLEEKGAAEESEMKANDLNSIKNITNSVRELKRRKQEDLNGTLPDSQAPKPKVKRGAGTYYDPNDVKQNDPNRAPSKVGIGAMGRKVAFGDVAIGNRAELALAKKNLQKGKDTFIVIPELKEIKTPYGNGVFRINDTKNIRYDGTNSVDIALPAGYEKYSKVIGNNPLSYHMM
jgi:hypothetical protein